MKTMRGNRWMLKQMLMVFINLNYNGLSEARGAARLPTS
ncbi:hypothetical protein CPS_0676 [Colwellia psychrerythraea 34H]|uniref:Uncharacterized protein n=1 Tax=Colwellia psychrerythraea (strain 34H / ATCC BAA-681) TaxID=167879 RepID=Q488T8_COLP3|nr:hypothetical protein CPS_0676 [Colwellia psychrerythraea 34H]